jgi:Domain of unknown function (DUF6378)
MTTTDQVIKERGEVYGDFFEGITLEAQIIQLLKDRYKHHYGLEMGLVYQMYFSKIAMKLSRLAVTPDHVDSWRDIAGYAHLVELHLLKRIENAKNP